MALTAVMCAALATVAASALGAVIGHQFTGTIAVPATGGVAVNQSTQDVFVADSGGISKVTAEVPASFVAGGSFSSLAVDSTAGTVYALDTTAVAVNRYDATGTSLGPIDGTGVTAGFFNPTAVAVDPTTEDVYVANVDPAFTAPTVIDVFDSTGAFKTEIASPVEAPFSNPSAMAIDGVGNLYILDGGNVNRYSAVGAFLGVVYSEFAAAALGIDPLSGDVYVVATDLATFQRRVIDYDSAGTVVYAFGAGNISFGSISVAADGTSGRVYVADSGTGSVPFFDSFDVPDPTPVTGSASKIKAFSALLSGTVNPNLNLATSWFFEYGTTTAYGQVAPTPVGGPLVGSSDVPVSTLIEGLEPSTSYHFSLSADRGTGPVSGGDQTFTTAPRPPGTSTMGSVSGVTATSASFTGTVDSNGLAGAYRFSVQDTGSPYSEATTPVDIPAGDGTRAASGSLGTLPAGTTLRVRLILDTAGGTSASDPVEFTTPPLAGPPPPLPLLPSNTPYGCVAPHLNAHSAKVQAGKAITLTGSDFGVGGTVTFGSTAADVSDWTGTSLRVTVPRSAERTTAVKVDCGIASNAIKVSVITPKAKPKHKAKAKKCKKGYVKKKVKGKTRCVKKPEARKGHH